MSWVDRLREAAYTSPSGVRTVFSYENVKRAVTKKTSSFEFPDADGTYVQDFGAGGRRYPVRVFLWGADYDIAAAAFEESLIERGVGRLEHPIYGTVDVIPFGEIVRRDDLKTAANQAVIEVTFWESTGVAYPTADKDPASAVLGAVDGFNTAIATEFAETPGVDVATQQALIKSQFERALAAVDTALAPVAAVEDAVSAQFTAIYDSITLGIDVLIDEPLTLGFQTVLLIEAPARAAAAISDRLAAYAGLLESLTSGHGAAGVPEFKTTDLFASTQVAAEVVAVVNSTFLTQGGAITAAEKILGQFEAFVSWRDDTARALAVVDTGEAYQQLQDAVALAAGYLVELSFTLKQERAITLTRPRTVIDLAAELYGEVDGKLDFLITSNNLTGDEIIELPRGRRIVYYV